MWVIRWFCGSMWFCFMEERSERSSVLVPYLEHSSDCIPFQIKNQREADRKDRFCRLKNLWTRPSLSSSSAWPTPCSIRFWHSSRGLTLSASMASTSDSRPDNRSDNNRVDAACNSVKCLRRASRAWPELPRTWRARDKSSDYKPQTNGSDKEKHRTSGLGPNSPMEIDLQHAAGRISMGACDPQHAAATAVPDSRSGVLKLYSDAKHSSGLCVQEVLFVVYLFHIGKNKSINKSLNKFKYINK